MEKIVIIPALNPDETLREIVESNRKLGNLVILVDDGSDENRRGLFEYLGEKCIVLRHRENRGKGEAIKTALRYIKKELWQYDVIGIMNADGQHQTADMERLLVRAYFNQDALVLGCRKIDDITVPWKSRMGNRITRQVFRLATGVYVSDTQTGLRAFSTKLLDFMLQVKGSRYEYEMAALTACAKRGIRIVEVPIQTIYHDKKNSCSHFHCVRDSIKIYGQLLKFSASSFSSFLLDYGLFVLLAGLLPHGAAGAAVANVSARLISAAYNYTINCRFVFREKQTFRTAADYFALAALILLLNSVFLQLFLSVLHIPLYPAKALTECTLFAISWLIQRTVIFKNGTARLTLGKGGQA